MSKTILFDLDGTLTDPKEGITKSVQYSLSKFKIEEPDLANLEKFIGPPLKDSYTKYYSFTEEQSIVAIEYYREYFSKKGMLQNCVYNGIPELLCELKNRGYILAVVTSKPTFFAKQILEYFKLDQYFAIIIGSNMDNTRTDKAEVIETVLKELNSKNRNIIMVGDRKHDLIGAEKNSIQKVGVLFGYGNRIELENESPDYIAENIDELRDFLLD